MHVYRNLEITHILQYFSIKVDFICVLGCCMVRLSSCKLAGSTSYGWQRSSRCPRYTSSAVHFYNQMFQELILLAAVECGRDDRRPKPEVCFSGAWKFASGRRIRKKSVAKSVVKKLSSIINGHRRSDCCGQVFGSSEHFPKH